VLEFGFIAFKPHIAAFLFAFFITFPIGFYLSMYVVFQGSFLRKRIQFIRYFIVALFCVGLNYLLLKFFIEFCGWYNHPTLSLMLTAAIVIAFSYFSQRHFSFQQEKSKSKIKRALSTVEVHIDTGNQHSHSPRAVTANQQVIR